MLKSSFECFLLFVFYTIPLSLPLPYLLLNLIVLMALSEHKWKYYRSVCRCWCKYVIIHFTFGTHYFSLAYHLCVLSSSDVTGSALFPLRCANFGALGTVWHITDRQFRRAAAQRDSASPKSASHGAVCGDDTSSQQSVFLVVYSSHISWSLI